MQVLEINIREGEQIIGSLKIDREVWNSDSKKELTVRLQAAIDGQAMKNPITKMFHRKMKNREFQN